MKIKGIRMEIKELGYNKRNQNIIKGIIMEITGIGMEIKGIRMDKRNQNG